MIGKRGEAGDGLMIFVWIAICAVVVGGIVWGTSLFYGQEYDIRLAENSLLKSRIMECFSERFFASDFNITLECGLNKEVLEEEHLIYINGNGKEFIMGVRDYLNQCFFEGKEGNDNYPRCVKGKVISKNDGKVVEYELTVGSNQKRRAI